MVRGLRVLLLAGQVGDGVVVERARLSVLLHRSSRIVAVQYHLTRSR